LAGGYRLTYFVTGEGSDLKEESDYVLCDKGLEAGLDRIKDSLRTWIEAGGQNRPHLDPMRFLSISVVGPLDGDFDRRTPEQRLSEANSPEERFHALGDAALSRFDDGQFEVARTYILELQEMLTSFEGNRGFASEAAAVQIILGRLALREGDIEAAKRHLIEAGRSEGSPTMSSFGPNMSLARDLLVAGEQQAVLDYFGQCRKFWKDSGNQLEEWEMYVNAGRIPDFGANLVY
jgi:hypothetical protein